MANRLCPFCAEEIQEAAIKCKHCGEWLSDKGSGEESIQPPLRIACADGKCTGAIGADGKCGYCGKSPEQVEQEKLVETEVTPKRKEKIPKIKPPPKIKSPPKISKNMRFLNPSNGHVEEVIYPRLYTFLFGFLYFAVKGVWTHAIASLVLSMSSMGISWLIYPFFASGIMRTHYLRKGWTELS